MFNKNVINQGKTIGRARDLVVSDTLQDPVISKIVVKSKGLEFVVPIDLMEFVNGAWIVKAKEINKLSRDERDFYLVEDLLDKQVIDVDGKRLVRVNDIMLKKNGELKIEGIDIGFSGILRRLNLDFLSTNMRTITLPWSLIEAFDYQTGNVQLKLTQSKLNTFHPAEIAEILEEAGTKERVGLINVLNAKQAADAIEEADEETQSAILEQVTSSRLKNIINRMKSSTIADIIDTLNPFTSRQILKNLEQEKAKGVRKLSFFADDEAGGLMDNFPYQEMSDKTVEETLKNFLRKDSMPEAIIVVDSEYKLIGTVDTKDLIDVNSDTPLSDLVNNKHFVYEDTQFYHILKLFSSYNLRLLPVVDREKKVIGAITIDSILAKIEEEEEV